MLLEESGSRKRQSHREAARVDWAIRRLVRPRLAGLAQSQHFADRLRTGRSEFGSLLSAAALARGAGGTGRARRRQRRTRVPFADVVIDGAEDRRARRPTFRPTAAARTARIGCGGRQLIAAASASTAATAGRRFDFDRHVAQLFLVRYDLRGEEECRRKSKIY